MTTRLEEKMNRLQKLLKSRCKGDGKPRPGYERNVAQIRADMESISLRIEFARQALENEDGE